MRMLGATVTRPGFGFTTSNEALVDPRVRDEQLAVSCIAGVVTFKLEDGTTIEVDEAQLQGALFEATHGSAA